MYYVLLPTGSVRDHVLNALGRAGIRATFHYVPLHSSPAAPSFCDELTDCPVTDDISARIIRLPFYNNLSVPDIERVVEAFVAAVSAARRGRSLNTPRLVDLSVVVPTYKGAASLGELVERIDTFLRSAEFAARSSSSTTRRPTSLGRSSRTCRSASAR